MLQMLLAARVSVQFARLCLELLSVAYAAVGLQGSNNAAEAGSRKRAHEGETPEERAERKRRHREKKAAQDKERQPPAP